MKKVVILTLALLSIIRAEGFSTLSDLRSYAERHPVAPKADNDNLLDPDYSRFHQSLNGGVWSTIKQLFTGKQQAWSANQFKTLLQEVTARRAKRCTGSCVEVLKLVPESRVYVYGDLHGALHSLVRYLTWLHEQGVLDENLTMVQPDRYLVFNGDAINRSAYSLETLTIILLLLDRNPDAVFYVRGDHETASKWIDFGLKRELQIRASSVSNEPIHLQSFVDGFFATLPKTLYITTPENPHDFIKITHKHRIPLETEKSALYAFAQQDQDGIFAYDLEQKEQIKNVDKPFTIQSIITTENWREGIQALNGLGLLDQQEGVKTWSVLSSPIPTHQAYNNFFLDAFIEITIQPHIKNSVLSLYNRDSRSVDPFKKVASYRISSAHDPSVKEQDIQTFTVGSVIPAGPSFVAGSRVRQGISAGITEINDEEVEDALWIRTVILNDKGNATIARSSVDQLLARNIPILVCPFGDAAVSAYLDAIKADTILALFPIAGLQSLRDSQLPGIINLRASYQQEVEALISYEAETKGARRFALFYTEDEIGRKCLDAAKTELKKKGITKVMQVNAFVGAADLAGQAKKIREFEPEVIGFFAPAKTVMQLMDQLRVSYLAQKELFTVSRAAVPTIRRFIKQHGLRFAFGAVVPNPNTSSLEIVQRYREQMDKKRFPYDPLSLESFIGTSILVDVVRGLDGIFEKSVIQKTLEGYREKDFMGLKLTFNPENRSFAQYVWIDTGDQQEWPRYTTTVTGIAGPSS